MSDWPDSSAGRSTPDAAANQPLAGEAGLAGAKPILLLVEGINAYATSYYLFYLFFLLERSYQFGSFENLLVSALNGLVYMACAWWGGRIGQRLGYAFALRVGLVVMMLALGTGVFLAGWRSQLVVMMVWTVGLCCTWPNLEALVCHGEPRWRLPRTIGIYNLVWAGSGALSYFSGGALLEHLGPRSLFYVPLLLHLLQLILLAGIPGRQHERAVALPEVSSDEAVASPAVGKPTNAKVFLWLAWLANPFAYMAMNSVLAMMPEVTGHFQLSPTMAGVVCSTWFFARFAAFLALWLWESWHYRIRWLLGAFALLIASLALMLSTQRLSVLILTQIVFGMAVGLIYYSSLFYSMDAGDLMAEHGGIHESAIGLGVFVGPAVAAGCMRLFPHTLRAGPRALTVLLVIGLALSFWMWRRYTSDATRSPRQ